MEQDIMDRAAEGIKSVSPHFPALWRVLEEMYEARVEESRESTRQRLYGQRMARLALALGREIHDLHTRRHYTLSFEGWEAYQKWLEEFGEEETVHDG